MRVSVEINGIMYEVEIEDEGESPSQVIINGHKTPIDMSPNWMKQFVKSLIVGECSHSVGFEYAEGGIPKTVWINGVPAEVNIDFPGKGKLHGGRVTTLIGASKDKIIAPIPGKIVEVRVKEGAQVTEGQILIVLEAMKMENELTAPRDVTIKQILCREGDNVELDQILINLG